MSDFLSLSKKRRSVRSYKKQQIDEKVLERILDAARMAPSARNSQNWKFIVVKDQKRKEELTAATKGQSFINQAPVIIAGVGLESDKVMSCDVPTYAVDLGIAMEHIALAAADEGLGSCWIGAFFQDKVKEVLNISDTAKVVALMPIGYPADSPKEKERKSLEEVVSYDKF